MYVTKLMLDNGYTGIAETDDLVAEFLDGDVSGLYVTATGAGCRDGAHAAANGDVTVDGVLVVEHTPDGVILRQGDISILVESNAD